VLIIPHVDLVIYHVQALEAEHVILFDKDFKYNANVMNGNGSLKKYPFDFVSIMCRPTVKVIYS